MTILVTGGAGYIGLHTVIELLNAGHDVVVVNNLSNGSEMALQRVEQITGKAERELGWRAERGLEEMMADTWRWQSANPNGYAG